MSIRFTIPSGVITTHPAAASELVEEVPEYDYTTKSIGVLPRLVPTGEMLRANPDRSAYANREPIVTGGLFGLANAVGLANPGAEEARRQIIESGIPKERIIASIFGKTPDEYRAVAQKLEDCVGALELNQSCPHSDKHGRAIGQDPNMVKSTVSAVRSATNLPVWAKFGLMQNLLESVGAAIEGGANGIVLLNTEGPCYYTVDGNQILYNGVGGMSGPGLFPKLVTSIKAVRERFGGGLEISACGGIRGAGEIKELQEFGVNRFGVGGALVGQTGRGLINYFKALAGDCARGTDYASRMLKHVDMSLKRARITRVVRDSCDFGVYETDARPDAGPGQFVFVFLPGEKMPDGRPCEKPFSVMDNNPLTFAVQTRGLMTGRINELTTGDTIYYRGPHGTQVTPFIAGDDVVIVGGGCGIAGVYYFAKKFAERSRVTMLLGAKDRKHIPYLDRMRKFGEVRVATEDGSEGIQGLVTDLFNGDGISRRSWFFNCGPAPMVEAVLPVELEYSQPERVFSSLDYITRCGIGICGSCIDKRGRRTCVEGPFMNP